MSRLKSEELIRLAEGLPYVINSALAESTNDKYQKGWEKWVAWCADKPEATPRPADPFIVSLYFNHLLISNGTVGSLVSAFYGIRWAHHKVGLPSPTENPFVKLAFEGSRRLCEHDSKKKEPLEVEHVKAVVDEFYLKDKTLMNARTVVYFLVGFTGFFRIEELVFVRLKNVKIYEDHMSIFVPESKADQHREGEKVIISRLNSPYCPVSFVEKFLKDCCFDIKIDKESFLLPRLAKTRSGHIAIKNRGISDSTMRELFKKSLVGIVENIDDYSTHSLRSGGASTAANNGISDRRISKQGRWKSDRGRNTYIKDNLKNRLQITKSLGL